MDTLVTTDWLSQHLDVPDLVVLDCTVRTEPGDGGGNALRPATDCVLQVSSAFNNTLNGRLLVEAGSS